jgi:hypothetical protein
MRVSKLLLALALTVSTGAFAYAGFQADFAVCTQGNNKGEVLAACMRLIDNAAAESRHDRHVLWPEGGKQRRSGAELS